MKPVHLFIIMAWLGLVFKALATPLTVNSQPTDTTTLISVESNKIFLPCQFDSFKTACLFDSGSSFSTVNSKLFDTYKAEGQIKYNGGTGNEIKVDKIMIRELKTADLNLKNWPVARLPHLSGFINIIGLDVFSKTPVLFDFKNRKIIINPILTKYFHTEPFIIQFGLILLPVQIGEQKLLATWDTGASICVVDQDYILKNPSEFTFEKDVLGTDATRTDMTMKIYKIKSLTIGGLNLKGVRVAAMDLSGMRKVHPNFPVFFLGYNVIIEHSWYFDLVHYQWNLS